MEEKASCFRLIKYDWIKHRDDAVAKFRSIEDEEDLINQIEILQKQVEAIIGCKWDVNSLSDIVLQQGFRLVVAECIGLFHLANEAIIRVLSLYFQMNRETATKALGIYKKFGFQIKKMQEIFEIAKQNRHVLMMDIPAFKSVFKC